MVSLTRLHPTEPLLRPRNLPWEANGLLNPGVTIYNGNILLLYRAVGDDHVSRLGIALSTDGVNFSFTSNDPAFAPDPSSSYEERGVEDPRISYIDGKYAIVYVAASINKTPLRPNAIDWKTRVSLAFTKDFVSYERKGVILHSYNDKNAALFPVKWTERGEEYYYLFHRRYPSIWISKTRDFNTWEDVCTDSCMVVSPDTNSWDNDRIGIGSQPIYTEDGWLVFYHGRDNSGVYRLGAFLADYYHPDRLISKLPYPILEPVMPFEMNGPIPRVVFTCGAVEAGEYIWVYYGGADYAIGGAYVKKQDLLQELKKHAVKSNVAPMQALQAVV
jgi:beta-1,2-mannobiose phosphorylase / 1,2-beta-oligomannan phosphorylase